jgi:antitoxin VapB
MYILDVYTWSLSNILKEEAVAITRVFKSGNSQAVRLPKEFQFDVDEVEIFRRGDEVVLRRRALNLVPAFELLAGLPEDFMQGGREDAPPQEREAL